MFVWFVFFINQQTVIKNVMNSLQDLRENRYNLITSLKTTSEN